MQSKTYRRWMIAATGGMLAACASQYPDDFYTRPGAPVTSVPVTPAKPGVTADAYTVDAYKRNVAQQISSAYRQYVYPDNPQAMLRAVIVVHYILDAEGRLLKSEIVRSNSDHYAENLALQSLRKSAPFPRPQRILLSAGRLDVSETWLFNDDGRFQLRSIALPQRSE